MRLVSALMVCVGLLFAVGCDDDSTSTQPVVTADGGGDGALAADAGTGDGGVPVVTDAHTSD